MTGMPISPAHAKPVSRRDHLWVLAIVATCALIKVSPSWVGIGAASGFPRFGGMPTDWTLAVVTDAYWAYALYAWLVAAPGPRSRRFAKWSAWGVFALSLIGQSAARLVPAAVLSAFANALPVIVLALIAFLIHLRHLDRAEAEAAAEESARVAAEAERVAVAADERVTLRAQLEALRADVRPALEEMQETVRAAETARDNAQQEAELAAAKAERLTRKLATGSGSGRGRNGRTRQPANGGRKGAETQVPKDVDARAEALALLSENPAISGAQIGKKVGMSERWGQLLKSELATVPADPEERT